MRATKTTRFGLVCLGLIAATLVLSSCGGSEPRPAWLADRGHLEECWAYYPFVEEVVLPEKVVAGEEFEITLHLYFPPDAPEELYYLPGMGLPTVGTVGVCPSFAYVLAVSDDPGWGGYELVPIPSREQWVYLEGFSPDPVLPSRVRTYMLSFLGAASREDAGLIRTVLNPGGGWLSTAEYEEWERYQLGDGKLKWFQYEITALPAEEDGAEE